MKSTFGDRVKRAVDSLPSQFRPKNAVILGSGLSGIVDGLGYTQINYSDIAEFPKPTVQGHKGIMYLSDKAAILAGRFHYYEGHPMDDVVLPIFVLASIGVKNIIITNAAGSINPNFLPGNLILIKDHINFLGTNPFIGPNPERPEGGTYGERFFDMSDTWTPELRKLAKECAGRDLREGVYCAMTGPSYETPAEIAMLSRLGGDLVGMSTVPEAIAARHLGMKILGISCVTNLAAGISQERLSHSEVVEVGKKVESELKALVLSLIDKM